jgi:hypothetical protein
MLYLYVKRYNFVGTFIINLVIFIIGKFVKKALTYLYIVKISSR